MKTAVQEIETAADVEMQIRGLMMDPVTNVPIVVLKDVAGETVLPIWVGMFEANAIALELEKTTSHLRQPTGDRPLAADGQRQSEHQRRRDEALAGEPE